MKFVTTIPAMIMAVAACVSLTAYATGADQPQAAETQAAKTDGKTVQPHSHLQEKTGIMPPKKNAAAKPADQKAETVTATDEKPVASTPPKSAGAKKVRADKDKSKHFHPRDK